MSLNGKGKAHPRIGHEGAGVKYRYNSTLSLSLALNACGCSSPRPNRFTPRNDLVPILLEWVGPRAGVNCYGKSLRFNPPTIQFSQGSVVKKII
jgi:hypothetical protein